MWKPSSNCRRGFRTTPPPLTFVHLKVIIMWLNIMSQEYKLSGKFTYVVSLCFLTFQHALSRLFQRSEDKNTKRHDRRFFYLNLVIKTWRKAAMNALLYSAPAHCLPPPPNGMKFLDITFASISYFHEVMTKEGRYLI